MDEKNTCMNNRSIRSSNIELLRIMAMAGVIFLHYFNANMGGGIALVNKGSINEHILIFLEAINICAVNLFVMISGFFLSRKDERSIGNVLPLLIQISVYRMAYYCITSAFNGTGITAKTMLVMFLPVNWFVILYAALYLFSPLLNHVLRCVDRKKVLITAVVLFSVWPTLVDVLNLLTKENLNALSTLGMYGSERGYTITNFVICYIVGACLNQIALEKIQTWKLVIFLAIDFLLMMLWNYWNAPTAREYCNPLVIAFAAVLLLLFNRIDIGKNKVINKIASCAFSIYIIHAWLLPYVRIEDYINRHPLIMLAHIFVSIVGIIACGFIVDCIFKLVFGTVLRKLKCLWKYSFLEQQIV